MTIRSSSHTQIKKGWERHRISEGEWHWTTDLHSERQEAQAGDEKNFEASINIMIPKTHGWLLCANKTFRAVYRPLEYWFPNCSCTATFNAEPTKTEICCLEPLLSFWVAAVLTYHKIKVAKPTTKMQHQLQCIITSNSNSYKLEISTENGYFNWLHTGWMSRWKIKKIQKIQLLNNIVQCHIQDLNTESVT